MKKKTFDAVAMKHKIQERQRKRLKGLSPAEESRLIQTEIQKDADLARIWERARRTPVSKSTKTN